MTGDTGRPLRISMVGLRGVPATFGGIERHVEELGARLAARGHHVTVWCRTSYVRDRPRWYRGMRLRYLPAIDSKGLEAITHSALSAVATLMPRPDVVHYHGVGPGLVAPVSRWAGRSAVVLTVHGLDGERAKWGSVARTVLQLATRMAAVVPHRTIGVSKVLAEHFRERYGSTAVYVPNGVEPGVPVAAGAFLARWGLMPGRYVLFVGRVVPEKAPDQLVRAFRARIPSAGTEDVKLVIAGGSSHTDEFGAQVRALSEGDQRVVHTGYVYGEDLRELYTNAALFVLPSEVEGLPLTLLEACAQGLPVVASDIPPHVEVLSSDNPACRIFPVGDEVRLAAAIDELLAEAGSPQQRAGAQRQRRRLLQTYSWDAATEQTEQVYRTLVARRGAVRRGTDRLHRGRAARRVSARRTVDVRRPALRDSAPAVVAGPSEQG